LEQPGTGHLTADEITALLDRERPGGIPPERVLHAKSCEKCKRKLAMHEEEDMRLRRLAGGPRGTSGDGCPSAEEWASLAAGLAEASRSDQLLAHAAQCDACGAILHALVEDFSEEPSEAEVQSMMELKSATETWQRQTARKMAQASGSGRVVSMPIRRWLARAAALVVAAGAGWMAWEQWIVSDPARLIAEAYAQQRPFEFRIPQAGHSEVRLERGANNSSFQRPPALLEAEAKIARELVKEPDSVKWLSLQARAELLSWDPETAITTLQRALDRQPGDPGLMADLGVAYALRAEADKRDLDYASAIEYLSRSLKVRPNSPETIFNRAVVYERMNLNDEATREWRHYLDLDPAGAWHDEALRRLNELNTKKKSGRQR
jgi:tetratricopeptide (TPR) repeat protein